MLPKQQGQEGAEGAELGALRELHQLYLNYMQEFTALSGQSKELSFDEFRARWALLDESARRAIEARFRKGYARLIEDSKHSLADLLADHG
jgi:hypothetical protein